MVDSNLISVLLPVKNASPYLLNCLRSISRQSYQFFEVICVDDGSSDDSPRILWDYSRNDDRFKVLKNPGTGIVDALSFAYLHSRGAYIHRMDADDLMPSSKLQNLLNTLLRANGRAVATGNVRYFSSSQVSQGYRRYEAWINNLDFDEEMYRECVVASPNWLVHRNCFEEDIRLADIEYPEDYDLVLLWHRLGYRFHRHPSVTHFWREHPLRTSRQSATYQQRSFFELKTRRFVQNELCDGEHVQLIGASKKGKLVAHSLRKQRVSFSWFDLRKQGDVYGTKVCSLSELKRGRKSILTVWPLDESKRGEVRDFIQEKSLQFGVNIWVF